MTPLDRMRAIARDFCSDPGRHPTPVPRLTLVRADGPSLPTPSIYEPLLCLGLRQRKEVSLGDRVFHLAPGRMLVASMDLPVTSTILDASPRDPYLTLVLTLDPGVISNLLLEMEDKVGVAPTPSEGREPGLTVCDAPEPLLDACARLVELTSRPSEIPLLAPLVEREILYRVLGTVQGGALRRVALGDTHLARISRAIDRIRKTYAETPRMDDLALVAGMSPSSFHRHFKAATALSPLAFLKRIRLQEARRLLVSGKGTAANVAYAVGYESPSQFSREYARLFGAPPSRDAARQRASGDVETVV
ncbi:MAG: AraC family transcriptional regulator [Rhodospirillum sp.]|nr:AraC family transcriptional regulator [Rhodospirillum sp.]MCF8490509.1 AraC family transcriptional regulator [Rhodospirillum sp.]MCF8500634.1 AraC family transcriptional regulator [Rhodospirillum sp.]